MLSHSKGDIVVGTRVGVERAKQNLSGEKKNIWGNYFKMQDTIEHVIMMEPLLHMNISYIYVLGH